MKSVKLGCLESVALRRLEDARRAELRHLRRDSFYWSAMAFLAGASSVVATAAAVGLHSWLSEVSSWGAVKVL